MNMRYGILSILLFFIVLILGYQNYQIWSYPSASIFPKETGKKGEGRIETAPGTATHKETVPHEAFNVIAEKNVFHPDRKDFSPAGASIGALGKPTGRPQVTLYGVVITGDHQKASIINPGRLLHKGERETKTIKIGDMVGEYKLTKVMPDRIVLEAGEDSFEVLLYDPRAPKKRIEAKAVAQPATVTSATSTGPPIGPPVTAAPAVVPRPTTPTSPPAARTTAPSPAPRTRALPPQESYQPSATPSDPAAQSTPTDPSQGRGRRTVSPDSPSN